MKRFLFLIVAFACGLNELRSAAPSDVEQIIPWLLEERRELKGIPFADVVFAATRKKVLRIDTEQAGDRDLVSKIGGALDRVLEEMNASRGAAKSARRINEVSARFEKAIRESLNQVRGFRCEFPKTATGRVQRSGYPDLRLVDTADGRVVYLDPKLYEQGSRESTLRTFYYEPKKETNKVLDDAHHLLLAIEHDGGRAGDWKFLGWTIVDLARFQVRLKAEFQGSNRDLYRAETIVGTSQRKLDPVR
ncbi:MAG: hypothetical protein AB1813_24785 [Verrucomicrobiota bacterium]